MPCVFKKLKSCGPVTYLCNQLKPSEQRYEGITQCSFMLSMINFGQAVLEKTSFESIFTDTSPCKLETTSMSILNPWALFEQR